MKKIFVFFGIIFFAGMAFADISYKDASIVVGGAFGYNFYSPSDHIKTAYTPTQQIGPYTHTYDDGGTYGGVCFNFWGLFKVGKSPVSLGVALGGTLFRSETTTSSHLVWSDTGEAVQSTKSLVGFHALFVTDLFLAAIGKNFLHFEAGAGIMLFDEAMYKPPFEPALDFVTTGRIILSIPIAKHWTIDPQIGIIKGFSQNNVFAFNFSIGVSALYYNIDG